MSRPEIAVVMPFAGDRFRAQEAVAALRSLDVRPGDELILVDNSGTVENADGVTLIVAVGELSPAHARNAGAAHAGSGWILFIDADTRPRAGLLEAYFERPPDDDVGAIAGEVRAAPGAESLAARYGSARSFLGQRAHLEHPFRPRAAAANLLVRRAAFEQIGGFYERVRAGEDTDFSWRLQHAGWRLELRPEAWVEHRYRATVSELRRQWRGYAAGRAWLGRRYEGFQPEPAVLRGLRRSAQRLRRRPAGIRARSNVDTSALQRGGFLALDVLLSLEELTGLALSNRPVERDHDAPRPTSVVTVADRFPTRGDPLVELAATLENVRVEAVARPEALDARAARALRVDYLEDDGLAARVIATISLIVRHPIRVARASAHRSAEEPPLLFLAPAVRRLEREPGARLVALGGARPQMIAERLAALAGRRAAELSHR